MSKSWIMEDHVCEECEYEIVVTQGKEADYRFYCSNPDCKNHLNPEDIGDMEECSFAKGEKI